MICHVWLDFSADPVAEYDTKVLAHNPAIAPISGSFPHSLSVQTFCLPV